MHDVSNVDLHTWFLISKDTLMNNSTMYLWYDGIARLPGSILFHIEDLLLLMR